MSVTTVLASFKTLVGGLSPSSGAAVANYAIPADINSGHKNGGMDFSRLPVTLVAQRLGNDAGANAVQALGAFNYTHNYEIEVMIALVASDVLTRQIGTASSVAVFAPHEAKAHSWLTALYTALVTDQTLGGTVYRLKNDDGLVITSYRIGYLPIDSPSMWGLWASVAVQEGI